MQVANNGSKLKHPLLTLQFQIIVHLPPKASYKQQAVELPTLLLRTMCLQVITFEYYTKCKKGRAGGDYCCHPSSNINRCGQNAFDRRCPKLDKSKTYLETHWIPDKCERCWLRDSLGEYWVAHGGGDDLVPMQPVVSPVVVRRDQSPPKGTISMETLLLDEGLPQESLSQEHLPEEHPLPRERPSPDERLLPDKRSESVNHTPSKAPNGNSTSQTPSRNPGPKARSGTTQTPSSTSRGQTASTGSRSTQKDESAESSRNSQR